MFKAFSYPAIVGVNGEQGRSPPGSGMIRSVYYEELPGCPCRAKLEGEAGGRGLWRSAAEAPVKEQC